MGLLDTN